MMLQYISNEHDAHHVQTRQNSIESLTDSLRDGKVHLLLGCSGSVATIKLPNIIQALSKYSSDVLSIRVILTPSASLFLSGQSREQPTVSALSTLPNVDGQYVDADEWKRPWVRGGGIMHIELRRWADLFVIAPLSANTMAKIVGGFADGLLTSVVRAWDPWGKLDATTANPTTQGQEATGGRRRSKKRRIMVAPAMNTAMWQHPITAKQLRVLEEEWGVQKPSASKVQPGDPVTSENAPALSSETSRPDATEDEGDGWFEVLRPQQKVLACGDAGDGAMIEWTQIVTAIEERLGL
ncbi:flavoprotein [Nemania sp. NC0429]|nr:flavoprotein [Nemania sp. NC0429]